MVKTRERRPSFSISHITRLRELLRDEVFFEFYGARLDGHQLARMIQLLQRALPGVNDLPLQDSLQHLLGQILTEAMLMETAARLAGNLHRLQQDIAALPWNGQEGREWVPCQIVSFQPRDKAFRSGDRGASYELQILAGSPCPRLITKVWPYKFCFLLGRRLGYTSRRGKQPLVDVSELVNLRMLVQLDPAWSRDGQPGFDKIHCGGALHRWNKDIIGRRYRVVDKQPWPCPRGFPWRCYQCPVGFDQCLAATHRVTLPIVMQGSQNDSAVPVPRPSA